jgi:prevent-host-death family protein
MHISNINEAKTHLSQLINRALAGDEVVIAKANEPLVKLVPIDQDTSPRIPGFWAGQVEIIGEWKEADQEIEGIFEASEIFPSEGS